MPKWSIHLIERRPGQIDDAERRWTGKSGSEGRSRAAMDQLARVDRQRGGAGAGSARVAARRQRP